MTNGCVLHLLYETITRVIIQTCLFLLAETTANTNAKVLEIRTDEPMYSAYSLELYLYYHCMITTSYVVPTDRSGC